MQVSSELSYAGCGLICICVGVVGGVSCIVLGVE